MGRITGNSALSSQDSQRATCADSAQTESGIAAKRRFALRYLGMGFYLAWIIGSRFTKAIVPAEITNSVSPGMLISTITDIGCLLVCVIFAKTIVSLLNCKSMYGLLFAAAAATACPVFEVPFPDAAPMLMVIGSASGGIMAAFLFLAWNELYSDMPPQHVCIYYAGSYVLSVAVFFLLLECDPWIAAVAEWLLPAASIALLIASAKEASRGGIALSQDNIRWSFPAKPVLLAASYTMLFFFLMNISQGYRSFDWLGGALVALWTLGMCVFCKRPFKLESLYKISLPLMVAGVLVWLIWDWGGLGATSLLTNASHTGFKIFTLVVLCNICHRYGAPPLWVFGILRIVTLIAETAAVYIGQSMALAVGTFAMESKVVTAVMLLVLVVVSSLVLDDIDFSSTNWAIVPKSLRRAKIVRHPNGTADPELFTWNCTRIAHTFDLTRREEEVLSLLVAGESMAAIEDRLTISQGTAKTHVRHIYEKLDIHSRAEAIDIVRGRPR